MEVANMDYKALKEDWNTYELADGTIIKMKTIVTNIMLTDQKKANGDPIYQVESTNVVTTLITPELKNNGENKAEA